MVLKRLKEMMGGSMNDEVEKRRQETERSRNEASQTTSTASPETPYVPPEPSAPTNTVEPVVEESATASSDQGAVAPPQVEETAPVEQQQETYRVEAGDTLSAIAQRFYGDASSYMRIFEANRDKLDNPDMIHPGQELVIPR